MRPLPLLAGLCSAAALWWTRPEFVDHWDEVQLALGVLEFDLTRHHPHPPGYPGVLALGAALTQLTDDPLEALRASSALAMGVWVTLVARALPQDKPAPVQALLTLSVAALPVLSPLLGYQGRAGLGYAWEACAWTAFALGLGQLSKSANREQARALGLGLVAGLLGALRPNLSAWAGALYLTTRPGWAKLLPFSLGLAGGAAIWMAGLAHLAGGAEAWWSASEVVLNNVRERSLLHADPAGWLRRLAMPGQLALAVGPLLLLSPTLRRQGGAPQSLIHAAAIAFLFHVFLIHDTSSYLSAPAACLAAWCLLQAARWTADMRSALMVLALVLLTGALPAWPLFDRETPPPGAPHDAMMRDTLAVIHQHEPSETLVITTTPGWRLGMRHLGWHAPQQGVLQLSVDRGFAVTTPARPYLRMRGRQLEAVGPADAPAQRLHDGPLQQLLVVGPLEGFLGPNCAPKRLGERVVALPPSAQISSGQLRCP